MFFYLRLEALTKFSVKVFVFCKVLVFSNFRMIVVAVEKKAHFFLIKTLKKFAQTKYYYKFALAKQQCCYSN